MYPLHFICKVLIILIIRKTVALKTVGLLSTMAQCGLHIPAKATSVIAMHNIILCDIGDGQSITQNLSTFSSHITKVIHIIKTATVESLVLLDELGSGTDPAEGMGIAISILEELRSIPCFVILNYIYIVCYNNFLRSGSNITPSL